MRVAVDERFAVEATAFSLRFTCDRCFHFSAAACRCAHEWPNGEHLDPRPEGEVVFCKEFELE